MVSFRLEEFVESPEAVVGGFVCLADARSKSAGVLFL